MDLSQFWFHMNEFKALEDSEGEMVKYSRQKDIETCNSKGKIESRKCRREKGSELTKIIVVIMIYAFSPNGMFLTC